MDLSQQLAVLRPRFVLIVLVTVIAGVLSFALASLIPKTYEAHATLLVGQVYDNSQASQPPQLNYDAFLASEQLATTFAQLADTRPVLAAVGARLGLLDDPTSLRDRVDAVTPPGSLFITISARAADDKAAADLANAVANELLAEAPGILAGANTSKPDGIVTLVDPAVPAEATRSPKVALYATLGALTALIVAVATIFMLAYRESSAPLRRTPGARRVGAPEPAAAVDPPANEPSSGPVVETVVETRAVSPTLPRPPIEPNPPLGPALLTEVRRRAPVLVAPPRPLPPVTTLPKLTPPVAPVPVTSPPPPAAATSPVPESGNGATKANLTPAKLTPVAKGSAAKPPVLSAAPKPAQPLYAPAKPPTPTTPDAAATEPAKSATRVRRAAGTGSLGD